VRRPDVRVPILSYHDVSPNPHPAFRRYSLTVREFSRQVRWLAARGYTALDMDALVAARSGGGALPAKPVVITFDDGFQNCVDHAVPILQAHGFTAVFYLVTGLMGSTSRWMADAGVSLHLMSWATARQLAAAGFQCGLHTATHPRLTSLDASRRCAELADSRRRAEEELGRAMVHFAYPYGAVDPPARESVAAAGYVTATSTRPGLCGNADDVLELPRITIHGEEPLPMFLLRLRTGRGVRETLRAVLGRPAQPRR
jgi:peptidoglycan/xylan/chitin deacetylase (PgdA/CDA1 family)